MVEYTDANGRSTVYSSQSDKATTEGLTIREMDCIDCHNRPSHPFELPDRALNQALAAGAIPALLPFIKKQAMEVIQRSYPSRDVAAQRIPSTIEAFYCYCYPDVYRQSGSQVRKAAQGVLNVYRSNVFPDMKVNGEHTRTT